MAKWIAKTLIQRCISVLPHSQSWNYLFQKHVTKSLHLGPLWFRRRLRECRWHLENYFETNPHPNGPVVELGTGWYPTIPIAFWLCGISRLITFDIQCLLRPAALKQTFAAFLQSAQRGELSAALPWLKPDRIDDLEELAQRNTMPAHTLYKLGIEARIQDFRYSDIDAGSVDFIYSNSVLHEIPLQTLTGIFAEFRRIASDRCAMSQYVLLRDLRSAIDSSVGPLDFLRYSDRIWELLDNPLQPANRLRISDYRQLHEESGFHILYEHCERAPASALDHIPIAEKFAQVSRDDLLVTRSWIVSAIDPGIVAGANFSPGWTIARDRS